MENVVWDPKQYLGFDFHRLRPALDLIARIPAEGPGSVIDLGCGPGNVTRILKERWKDAEVTGVDNSEEMLVKARESYPDINWQTVDLNNWQSNQPVDVLFSNAALHWLEDHDVLFPQLLKSVKPGGYLAVQMPRNWEAASHMSINETVASGKWRERLESVIRLTPSLAPEKYYEILAAHVSELEIWETDYIQVLEGENPVAEYVKGSWLQRFLQELEEPESSEFEAIYREKILEAYPKQSDGKTLFPFKRCFILARL